MDKNLTRVKNALMSKLPQCIAPQHVTKVPCPILHRSKIKVLPAGVIAYHPESLVSIHKCMKMKCLMKPSSNLFWSRKLQTLIKKRSIRKIKFWKKSSKCRRWNIKRKRANWTLPALNERNQAKPHPLTTCYPTLSWLKWPKWARQRIWDHWSLRGKLPAKSHWGLLTTDMQPRWRVLAVISRCALRIIRP